MADANSTRYSKLPIEDKSPAELAEEFPINGDPCSVWFDYDQKEGRASWAVNDENGDAIDVLNYESAVKVAAAFSRKEHISLENYDVASVKIQQLDAMINAITGEGFEHFQNMNDEAQHWYLMAVADYAMDISKAIKGGEA